MTINFKTCLMYDGNEWKTIKTQKTFDSLFEWNQIQGFARFRDEINGENKYGCIDKYGFEYYTKVDDAQKAQELILKEFPLGSMKFYIFRKIYEN